MRKPIAHKEKHSNRYEISQNHSVDDTSARTRPYSFDEIMLKRKKKKQSGNIQDHRLASEIVSYKESESISGHVESDRHRHRHVHGGNEQQHACNEPLSLSSRTKENKSMRENKESDRRKEKGVHEKRIKIEDKRVNDGKDFTVKERERNIERNNREKLESRKRHERDKRRSNSPSNRGNKQRMYESKQHEELLLSPSHSSKDNRKRVSNNNSNNKFKRHESHDTSVSRLGGYSPRKRRNETSVKIKTPPPIDSPPVKLETKIPNSELVSLSKIEVPNRHEVPNVVSLTSNVMKPKPNFGILSIPKLVNASVDSVQLTQATRPKRRIYVENLPSSATETSVVEWLSGYLRPYGLSHIQTTSPCISCIVNKEKSQALVEFLTPEDASTALSFDGRMFFGNVLKIRRPKDYVETTTGDVSHKSVAGSVSIKNIVQDSPNKIFVGGISKIITSEMLMEIASAFGPLKAFHFEPNSNLDNSPCAFLEYVDQSVTIKACVGLNGMKLGGQLLTVTQATPDTSSMENHGDHPFYGTPSHVQPLLEKQTQVLKLNNLVDPQSLSSLSKQEFEEILEDVRVECSRFGMVKSVNIVKPTNMSTSLEKEPPEEHEVEENKCKVVEEGFEGGCVMVEYKRKEACEMAAHCLHGRIFDGRIVSVEYVEHDVYCEKFEK